MEQYRNVEVGHFVEDRRERGVVERPSLHVGIDLDGTKAQLPDRAVELIERPLRVVHRKTGRRAKEAVGKTRDQLRHLVIRDPRQFQCVDGTSHALNRRIGRVDDLHVAFSGCVHDTEPAVQIEQRRKTAFRVLQPHSGGRDLHAALVVPGSDDVIEGVNFHKRM